jgi:hypothetical protein
MNKTRKRQLEESLADAIAPIVRKPPDKSLIDSLVERYSPAHAEQRPRDAESARQPAADLSQEVPPASQPAVPPAPIILADHRAGQQAIREGEQSLSSASVPARRSAEVPPAVTSPIPSMAAASEPEPSLPPAPPPQRATENVQTGTRVNQQQAGSERPLKAFALTAAHPPGGPSQGLQVQTTSSETKASEGRAAALTEAVGRLTRPVEYAPIRETRKTARATGVARPARKAPAKAEKAAKDETKAFEEWLGPVSHFLRGGQRAIVQLIFERTVAQGRPECLITMPQLADLTGLTERHCYHLLNQLVSLGFVTKGRTYNTAEQRGTAFSLHPPTLQ